MKKQLAVLALATVLAVPWGGTSASAVSVSDLWVDNTAGQQCSDSAGGTVRQPFCTLAAATAALMPGTRVHVMGGPYAELLVINQSGTAGQPITFDAGIQDTWSLSGAAGGVRIQGQHDISLSRMRVLGARTAPGFAIDNSSRITLTRVYVDGGTDPATPAGIRLTAVTDASITKAYLTGPMTNGIEMDAATNHARVTSAMVAGSGTAPGGGIDIDGSDNTLINSHITGPRDTGIVIRAHARNTVVTNNYVGDGYDHGIHNDGGTGTAITNNTVRNNCADGILVNGPSSAVSVENNVSTHNGDHTSLACGEFPTGVEIGIYGTATADALVDYNIVQNGSYHGDEREYAWNTPVTLDQFRAASGQGGHDIANSWDLVHDTQDSANSAARGWQSLDVEGRSRVDNPAVPNTGAGPISYADRGYLETRDAPTPRLTVTAQPSPHGALITADATATTTWLPLTITTYNFSFGDGTGVTQSTPIARHTYTTFGTYPVTVEVRDSSGTTARITTTTWTYLPIPRVPTSVSSSRRPPVRR